MKPNTILTLMRQGMTGRLPLIGGWIAVWSLLGALFTVVFEDLSKTAAQTDAVFKTLPPAVLRTVNISDGYLTQVEKFLSGQFLTIYLLAGSILALSLGISAIGGKIKDATIMNLLTKPLSRPALFLSQTGVNFLTLIVANACVWLMMAVLFNLLSSQEIISGTYFISGFIGTSLIFLTMSALGGLLGLVTSRAMAFGSFVIVASYFLNGLGGLGGLPGWVQKSSLFYYFNTIQLRDEFTLDWQRITVLAVVTFVLIIVGTFRFKNKDIYL